jgi:hypothetical protein
MGAKVRKKLEVRLRKPKLRSQENEAPRLVQRGEAEGTEGDSTLMTQKATQAKGMERAGSLPIRSHSLEKKAQRA